jgi:hypothetical protein
MGYYLPETAPVKPNLTAKNRGWGFFGESVSVCLETRRPAPETHQENDAGTQKAASGIPLWPSRDPIEELGGVNLYGFVGNGSLNFSEYLGRDRLVLAGGPTDIPDSNHDIDWRLFITASEIQIHSMQYSLAQGEKIVWAVSAKSYEVRGARDHRDYKAEIERSAKQFGDTVVLKWVDSTYDVIDVFNNTTWGIPRDGSYGCSAPPPESSKIRSFTYFGHGLPGVLALGYNQDYNKKSWDWEFSSDDLIYLVEGSISKGCLCISYTCNSATGSGPDGKGPSFADAWKATFWLTLYAIKGRSSYAPCGQSHWPFYTPKLPIPSPTEGSTWVPHAPPTP